MKFPYRRYSVTPTPAQLGETVISRPIIRFRLHCDSESALFWGLLDTGADETYITKEMADALGIVASESFGIESASGRMTASYATVHLEVSDDTEQYQWPSVIGVIDQPWSEAILGHAGFLRYFDVTFLGKSSEVILQRNELAFQSS